MYVYNIYNILYTAFSSFHTLINPPQQQKHKPGTWVKLIIRRRHLVLILTETSHLATRVALCHSFCS